jgi:cell division protein FtsA
MAREREPAVLLLDLGTQHARAAAARLRDGALRICGAAEVPFSAARDGIIVHLDSAREQLAALLDAAGRRAGVRTRLVVAAVGGMHLRWVRARGSLSLRPPVCVRDAHLERALDTAAAIGLPRDQETLHVVPTGFRVDGARTVRPLGMRARRLVAEAAVLTVSRLALENLERVLSDAGYELVEPVAEPLAAAHHALTHDDRARGAVLVDLGAERSSSLVFRDGALRGLAQIGAGAGPSASNTSSVWRAWRWRMPHATSRCGVAARRCAWDRSMWRVSWSRACASC